MKKMYFASTSTLKVYPIDVIMETQKTVRILESGKERQYSKAPSHGMYFNSELEAWEFLENMTGDLMDRVVNIKKQIERLKNE